MDNYHQYQIEELVWDTSFRQWVLQPTPELNASWNQYIQDNPQKASVISQAREIIVSLQVQSRPIAESDIQQRIRHTMKTVRSENKSTIVKKVQPLPWYNKQWVRAAASVVVILGICWSAYSGFAPDSKQVTYQSLIGATKTTLVEKINNSEKPLKLRLTDGSWVTLQKHSKISYNPQFKGSKREVYLNGEAFFEVVKDPDRPFLVFANELVTKVLGTSFKVKAYASDSHISVEVKTGKVSVFADSELKSTRKVAQRELEGVVLTPNQKIVFSRDELRMRKSLVEKPLITLPQAELLRFEFDDTPVSEVFAVLEKSYSVDIVYDEELMHNCPLTASLTNESLFEKLNIICKAVEARYSLIDGQIVIDSKGCN
jgi:ferric-dicitrate binding protein FerR (iron transport regulator)